MAGGEKDADSRERSETTGAAGKWSIPAGQEGVMAQNDRLGKKEEGFKYREKAVEGWRGVSCGVLRSWGAGNRRRWRKGRRKLTPQFAELNEVSLGPPDQGLSKDTSRAQKGEELVKK